MLIYTAGPIRPTSKTTTEENIRVAGEVALELWQMGHSVICPHGNTNFAGNDGIPFEAWMKGDLQQVARCDALVMLPHWRESEGARMEYEYALSLGIPVYEYPDVPPLHPTEVRCPEQAKAFAEVVGQMYRTHLKKNADYSPNNILGTGRIGLLTRTWDKMARLLHLAGFNINARFVSFDASREPANESVEDSLLDLAVYAVIGLLLERGQWGR